MVLLGVDGVRAGVVAALRKIPQAADEGLGDRLGIARREARVQGGAWWRARLRAPAGASVSAGRRSIISSKVFAGIDALCPFHLVESAEDEVALGLSAQHGLFVDIAVKADAELLGIGEERRLRVDDAAIEADV